jgi:hypothetical protein
MDVTAERLAVAFTLGQQEVVGAPDPDTGGSVELQGSAV